MSKVLQEFCQLRDEGWMWVNYNGDNWKSPVFYFSLPKRNMSPRWYISGPKYQRFFFFSSKLIWEREREREVNFIVPLIYIFIGWFLYVPWPKIKPATLAYQGDVLTNWATQPGSLSVSYIRCVATVLSFICFILSSSSVLNTNFVVKFSWLVMPVKHGMKLQPLLLLSSSNSSSPRPYSKIRVRICKNHKMCFILWGLQCWENVFLAFECIIFFFLLPLLETARNLRLRGRTWKARHLF